MLEVMLQTKFEAITFEDVRGDAFLARAGVLRQVLDVDCHYFLLPVPMVTILIFLQCL